LAFKSLKPEAFRWRDRPVTRPGFSRPEAVVGPVLIAALLLPHFVPAPLVQQIRAEAGRKAHS
jgi:hypothetical protein